jgi:hypothetical protein
MNNNSCQSGATDCIEDIYMIITMEQTLRRKRNTNVLMSRAIGMQLVSPS